MTNVQSTSEFLAHEGASQGIRLLNLANLIHLFRNEEAFDQFISIIVQKTTPNALAIISIGETVIATMRPAHSSGGSPPGSPKT
jgi:hypothetical protein